LRWRLSWASRHRRKAFRVTEEVEPFEHQAIAGVLSDAHSSRSWLVVVIVVRMEVLRTIAASSRSLLVMEPVGLSVVIRSRVIWGRKGHRNAIGVVEEDSHVRMMTPPQPRPEALLAAT
jgi:hypothetical protein